MNASILII